MRTNNNITGHTTNVNIDSCDPTVSSNLKKVSPLDPYQEQKLMEVPSRIPRNSNGVNIAFTGADEFEWNLTHQMCKKVGCPSGSASKEEATVETGGGLSKQCSMHTPRGCTVGIEPMDNLHQKTEVGFGDNNCSNFSHSPSYGKEGSCHNSSKEQYSEYPNLIEKVCGGSSSSHRCNNSAGIMTSGRAVSVPKLKLPLAEPPSAPSPTSSLQSSERRSTSNPDRIIMGNHHSSSDVDFFCNGSHDVGVERPVGGGPEYPEPHYSEYSKDVESRHM